MSLGVRLATTYSLYPTLYRGAGLILLNILRPLFCALTLYRGAGISYQCCSPEVGMLPEASAECNIPTKGEQHACYMAEHLTIDLLYHYHMNICIHVTSQHM